jgi:hypothetical protein
MSAEAKNLPLDDDINTTMPQPKPEVWKMPEPVFRRTSGRLPKDYPGQVETATVEVDEVPSTISSFTAPEPKPKSPVLKIIVVGLALAAMIAFLIVFLTIVYFFFMRDASAPPPT